jgi:outer membrane protein assembly factor BamE
MRMLSRMKSRHHTAAIGVLAAGRAGRLLLDQGTGTGCPTDTSGVKVTGKSNSLFGFLKPYRIDIQQGNFVSKEMVAQLRPGLTATRCASCWARRC